MYLLYLCRQFNSNPKELTPLNILSTTRALAKSQYTAKQKRQLILTYLHLVLLCKFKDKSKKIKRIKFLGKHVYTFNYKMFMYIFIEIFVREDYCFYSENPNPTIIDCGANIGLATLYFKTKYPDSTIIAFEANSDIFELLQMNINNNNIQGVNLINAAVSKVRGDMEFFPNLDLGWNFGVGGMFSRQDSDQEKIVVQAVQLSTYIGNSIEFVKMDIEGAENDVILELFENGKLENINELIIEYHHRINGELSKLGEFLKLFEKANFQYQIQGTFIDKSEVQALLIRVFK